MKHSYIVDIFNTSFEIYGKSCQIKEAFAVCKHYFINTNKSSIFNEDGLLLWNNIWLTMNSDFGHE